MALLSVFPGGCDWFGPTRRKVVPVRFRIRQSLARHIKVLADAAYTDELGYGFEPGSSLNGNFSVEVPTGGNYRVTVVLGDAQNESVTTVKAELRRLMLERVRTAPGKFETRSFIVNVRRPEISTGGEVRRKDREKTSELRAWDDKLTLEFTDVRPSAPSRSRRPIPFRPSSSPAIPPPPTSPVKDAECSGQMNHPDRDVGGGARPAALPSNMKITR
jgi:hypothetical protein